MIIGTYLVSAVSASKADYVALLTDVGTQLQITGLATGHVFDADSNVWIELIDAGEPCYEESTLKDIEALLEGAPKTFISLEFDGGETAYSTALNILRAISERWPIVYDDNYGRLYAPSEIIALCENGEPAVVASPACPASYAEAVEKAWCLASEPEKDMLRRLARDEARLALHFTLGHRLGTELALWGSDITFLFDDLNRQAGEHLATDAHTATAALIDVLWAQARRRT